MKAKLEVEMPEGCYDCQFCAGTECGAVEGMPTIDLFGEEDKKPQWCPLTPEEAGDVKLQTDWIPVSERLPELHVDVFVTFWDQEDTIMSVDCLVDGDGRGKPMWATYNGALERVLAWMPLPEKYRPD